MRFLREHTNWVVIAGLTLVVVCLLLISGCGAQKQQEPFKDAPTKGHDDSPAQVINMPDGFSNLATKCVGTTRVFSAFHGDSKYGAITAVPNDPSCGGEVTP